MAGPHDQPRPAPLTTPLTTLLARLAALAPFLFIFLWSMAFVAVRAGLPDVSPLYFLGVRFALASAILIAAVIVMDTDWRALRGRWHHFVIAGVLINAFYLSAGYLAMTTIPGASLALLGSLHPLLTALLAGPLLGERLKWWQWLGLGFGTAGVALVVGLDTGDLGRMSGMAWGVVAAICLTAGTLYYSRYCRQVGLTLANTVQLSAAAMVTLALAFAFEDIRADWTPTALVTLGFLAIGVSLGGMGLLLFMLRTGTAGKVSANFYLTPGATAVLGWAILGEALTAPAIAGFAVASFGVWLVNRAR